MCCNWVVVEFSVDGFYWLVEIDVDDVGVFEEMLVVWDKVVGIGFEFF